jgi:hypothetical protein
MHASFNRICDPLCVSFGTLDHRRRQGMEKVKSHKVETRMIGANSTLVLWKSLIVEYRQVDPAHPVIEAGAPDYVGDVHHCAVVQERLSIFRASQSSDTLHTGATQIFRSGSDERPTVREHFRPRTPANRSVHRKHSMKDESQHQPIQHEPGSGVDSKWHVSHVTSG